MSSDLGFIHRWEPREDAARTLLLLHGTGGDENDLIPLGDMLDREASLLSPRGQVMEGGMPRFFKRLAMGVFDEADLKSRADDLGRFVDEAAKQYGFATEAVTAAGFSNGANIAGALLLRRPGLVREAVLLRPMLPYTPEALPDLKGTRVFLAGGERDPMVGKDNVERWAQLLRDAGADVTLRWSAAGHELTGDDVAAARAWLLPRAGAS